MSIQRHLHWQSGVQSGRHDHEELSLTLISHQAGNIIVTESSGNSLNKPDTVGGVFRVSEGGAVDLPCLARGHPLPVYTWYKLSHVSGTREKLTASPSLFPRHSVLSIVGASASDSGRYVCQVSNEVNTYSVEHVLEVTSPLSVHVFPPTQVTDSGDTAVFNCTVDGFPVVNIYWLKDGQIVLPSSRINPGTGTLTIRRVGVEDKGDSPLLCKLINQSVNY